MGDNSFFSRFRSRPLGKPQDPYASYNDIDPLPPQPRFGPAAAASSSKSKEKEKPPAAQPEKKEKPPSSFMPSATVTQRVVSPPRARFGKGKVRARRKLTSSSTDSDEEKTESQRKSSDEEEKAASIGANMYTTRKRKYADLQATSSSAQMPQASEYADQVYELIKQTNFQSSEQEVEQAIRRVFGRHDSFFTNLRMFVSAFEGSISAKVNDFWRTGESHSYKELAKMVQDHFQGPSSAEEEQEDPSGGYASIVQHFGSGVEPVIRTVQPREMAFIWKFFEFALKACKTRNVVVSTADFVDRDTFDAVYAIQTDVLAARALVVTQTIAFNHLGIQLTYSDDVVNQLRLVFVAPLESNEFEKKGIPTNDIYPETRAHVNLKDYVEGKYDPSVKSIGKVDADALEKTLELIKEFNQFFDDYVDDLIYELKQKYAGPGKPDLFQWMVYDDDLKPPPLVNYLLEIRHLSQLEQEQRLLEATGLIERGGDLRANLMPLLERMAKPNYFAAVQQAYYKIKSPSLYEIINDPKVLGPRFVNLCRAQFNYDRGNSSSYTSAVRNTKNEIAVGQAIDDFRRATAAPSNRQIRIQLTSMPESTVQLEEFIRAAVLQGGAII